MNTKALMICGITSGSGKTTVTQGILSILVTAGFKVKSFKLGPDYIDSGHHSAITGNPCVNIDKFLLSPIKSKIASAEIIREHFLEHSSFFDFLIVEAVGGIYDDWNNDGNSPYQIAVDLDIPILLIVDGFSYSQTMGLIINSLIDNDKHSKISGVLINKVSSKKHFSVIASGVKKAYKNKVIGYIPLERSVFLEERHLGLETSPETSKKVSNTAIIEIYSNFFSKFLSVSKVSSLSKTIKNKLNNSNFDSKTKTKCRIAIAKDEAFSFYYWYNLKLLENLGAELVFFSPIDDSSLPEEIDAIYLGGGFPELYSRKLELNQPLKKEIRVKIDDGLPVYAECGGLMYLGKSILYNHTEFEMLGIFNFSTEISEKTPLSLDYVVCKIKVDGILGKSGTAFKGHIFHKSSILINEKVKTVTSINTVSSNKKFEEGYTYKNCYASYVHIHFASNPNVAKNLVSSAVRYKKAQTR